MHDYSFVFFMSQTLVLDRQIAVAQPTIEHGTGLPFSKVLSAFCIMYVVLFASVAEGHVLTCCSLNLQRPRMSANVDVLSSYLLLQNCFCSSSVINVAGQKTQGLC